VEGALAADSLIQAPRRTSATVAALMLSLALVIGQGGVARAAFDSIQEWIGNTLNPDLFVSTSQNLSSRDFHFSASMYNDLIEIPGIEEIQPVRTTRVQFRGAPVMIVAVPLMPVAGRVRGKAVEGDRATMYRLAGQGKGFIIAENLAILEKLSLNQTLELQTPSGPLRLPIVGIIRDFSNQLGAIFMDRSVYIRYYGDDSVDIFRIYLKPGFAPEGVRRAILERMGSTRMFVLLNREVRDYVLSITSQWFGMTYLQVLVAVVVAVLGIVNTLTVSIADRRRELGVLRAVGGLRNQIRGTVWLEAAAIGLIGLILGLATGAINLYYELEAIRHDLAGLPLSYEFPFGVVAILIPVILLSALGSAILPAETAVRSSLVEALEYE